MPILLNLMDSLVPIFARLQTTFSSIGLAHPKIDLPQIAVVGAQSVGKSSVLEGLVGKDFLPRGNGTVTRRPLLLQLYNTQDKEERAEFLHLPGEIFTDFSQVKNEINRVTENKLGSNKTISGEIIHLKIYSPNVVNLTLVDLPGITKVPVGDQPQDIEAQVKSIIMHYITNPNCIILAITAANTDIANSDSLKLAREVDPYGDRTIGVITKCDTLEEDIDAQDSILGKIYPLKLGYIGVVCRNQKQTSENRPIDEALKNEENFFSTHPTYSSLKNGCGIKALASSLNKILLSRIMNSIPEVKSRLTDFLQNIDQDLSRFEEPIACDDNPGALLLNFFSRFSRHFEDALDGKLPCQISGQLTGGARINFIFHDWYTKVLKEFNPLSGLSDLEIRTTIRNTAGPRASLFVPDSAFEILVKRQILHLEPPSLKCVQQVYIELRKIVETCDLPELKRYSKLREQITIVVNDILSRLLGPANKMIRNLIKMQTAYINTSHPQFMNNVIPLLQNPEDIGSSLSVNNDSSINYSAQLENQTPNINSILFQTHQLQNDTNLSKKSVSSDPVKRLITPPPSKPKSTANLTEMQNNSTANPTGIFGYFLKSKTPKDEVPELLSFNDAFQNQEQLSLQLTNIKLPVLPNQIVPTDPPSRREVFEINLIKILIHTYFCIVRQGIADSVPKAIMHFMVNSAKDVIPRQLVATLYKDELFSDLLMEDERVIQKRSELKDLQSKIITAIRILDGIPASFEIKSSKRD